MILFCNEIEKKLTKIFSFILFTPTAFPGCTLPPQISSWATFLGVSSVLLTAIQYAPQILRTHWSFEYTHDVDSNSKEVYSWPTGIALRKDTN
ncbi:hypothetical protein BYT27DRAFT_7206089 [Phlegmacium glaucopus]|nr:hypothetical protein BYT27DRAFT_7206089 [Phlegmacium glaucopus]